MNRARNWTMLALALWSIRGPSDVDAQESKPPPPTVLTIHPAKQPDPALKYRLIPERRELVPGNAAIFYHRANLMIATAGKDPKGDEKAFGWLAGPAKDVPLEAARSYLERFRNELHEAELGAFRETCDWELDHREEGFSLLLPEIQELRRVGRLAALKARVEILDGRLDEAVHWIEVGHAMSRHLGEAPFLISDLVGMAISGQFVKTLEELIQTNGGPNLYWALATRPRPLIDMRRALDGERCVLEREVPRLRELDGPAWSAEKARSVGDEMFAKLRDLTGGMRWIAPAAGTAGAGAPRLEDLSSRLTLAAVVARVYPEAKRSLIAGGKSAADVEAMPAFQVVLIHTFREYSRLRDDTFKWAALPYWQAHAGMVRDETSRPRPTTAAKVANPILTMFTMLMPAIGAALQASARSERTLDALQCVEAVRMYAADHGGALPDSLDAMTGSPAPVDPALGKPFEYKKVDDATAVLSAPYPPGAPHHPAFMIHYELKLVK